MFDFYRKRDKRRILIVSAILLLALILSTFASTDDYNRLEQNMSAIYKDRLMPAYYLFRINDLLHTKNSLANKLQPDDETVQKNKQANQLTIDSLIRAYELTYLTTEEKKEWKVFLSKLKEYNVAELATKNGGVSIHSADSLFMEVNNSLNRLSEIQASEGKLLQANSKAIVYGSVIYTYLQIALMIILIVIVIMTISSAERIFYPSDHPQSLN
ncbi:MAG: MCP four helix bundle domain-containing protein [Lacibacter sp.]